MKVSLFIASIIACTLLQACCSSYTNISWYGRTPFCTPVLGSKVRYFITCLFIAHLSPIFRFLFSLLKNIRSRDLLLDSKYFYHEFYYLQPRLVHLYSNTEPRRCYGWLNWLIDWLKLCQVFSNGNFWFFPRNSKFNEFFTSHQALKIWCLW